MLVNPIGLQMSFGEKLFHFNCHNFFSSSVALQMCRFLFGCQGRQRGLNRWMSGAFNRHYGYGAGKLLFAARVRSNSACVDLPKLRWLGGSMTLADPTSCLANIFENR